MHARSKSSNSLFFNKIGDENPLMISGFGENNNQEIGFERNFLDFHYPFVFNKASLS
jgi:hypothetical protein